MGVMAQSGKIAGTVIDASTGELLPGVNVVIDGTTQGSTTDVDGFYTILNVRPGTYTLRASFVGFRDKVVEGVRVSTNLTKEVNFDLQEETVGLDEVVVTAQAPIVQVDVSANVANLNPEEFQDLPVAGVDDVLNLQAGIEPGLQIRGGGLNEVGFILDGMNLRGGRNNDPFTGISFTSVEEVQVQTGGFNAEYGNVRSGIVNVATKDPSRTRYTFDGLFRYTPAQDKSRGGLPTDFDSYYMRPFLDSDVNLVGIENGSWDSYTRDQYADFQGWNSIVERLQGEGFDVDAEDMVELFQYQHRKDNTITTPDYQVDFTVGGPLIPGLSNKLGDLRFLASYRGTQTAYLYPQTRDAYDSDTYQFKLTSDVGPGMKLTVNSMLARERGVDRYQGNADSRVYNGNIAPYPWGSSNTEIVDGINRRGRVIFSDGAFPLANVDLNVFGGDFVHTLNANTFYEVSVQNVSTKYRSGFPNLRDATFFDEDGNFVKQQYTDGFGNLEDPSFANLATCFGGDRDLNGDGETNCYYVGEEPFGYSGIGGNLLSGETTGGHWNKVRDTSNVSVTTGRFDLSSQVNRVMFIKTGAELIFSDYNMRYGRVNLELEGEDGGARFPWKRSPIQGALYAQTKLEFGGMIANLGLRMDYFDANTDWWVYDVYDQNLRGTQQLLNENAQQEATEAQFSLSPRLGISFPITEDSKLYFNYGHFRQMLNPQDIFGVEQSRGGGIDVIGNPDHPMMQTVSYELGFDQNLFDQYLLRISGFYKDIRNQPRGVRYLSLGDVVDYTTLQPWNYEDIRGAEFSLTKRRGKYFRGFVNYTYTTTKSGNFGFSNFYENSFAMLNYLRSSTDYRINAPLAQPYANMNLQFFTPEEFGPTMGGINPLGDWVVNFLGEWRDGQKWRWQSTANFPELQENVSWRDFWNFDLRFTKHFNTTIGDAQFFIDVRNVFNLEYVYSNAAFHPDKNDFDKYMRSLHLPEDIFDQLNDVDEDLSFSDKTNLPYVWVPGSDQPGDFRDTDVAWQPIEAVSTLDDATEPNTRAWYWAKDSGTYHQWNGSAWSEVSSSEVQDVLDNKAYIDMPNLRFNTFLNPRTVLFGFRLSF
ncbi:MAG: hypothetical protein RhofKO_40070 [Rhodothermales bacterium]